MPDILARGLDQETAKRLRERAGISGRSVQQEVNDLPAAVRPTCRDFPEARPPTFAVLTNSRGGHLRDSRGQIESPG